MRQKREMRPERERGFRFFGLQCVSRPFWTLRSPHLPDKTQTGGGRGSGRENTDRQTDGVVDSGTTWQHRTHKGTPLARVLRASCVSTRPVAGWPLPVALGSRPARNNARRSLCAGLFRTHIKRDLWRSTALDP